MTALGLWPVQPAAAADMPAPPAVWRLEDIRRNVGAQHRAIRSLLVEYRGQSHVRGVPGYSPGSYVLRTAAAKRELRYLRTAHITPTQSVDNDPDLTHTYYNGEKLDGYAPFSRLYETSRHHAHPSSIKARGEPYFESIGWWPADDPSSPPILFGRPFFLGPVLAGDKCAVLPHQELVRGRWCHVVQVGGKDRLLFDSATGSLWQREVTAPGTNNPAMRYELDDLQELPPGVWLPFRVRRVEYSLADHEVLFEFQYEVVQCEVNAVDDALFTHTPGPGTVVYDRDTDTSFQVPGGHDLLDAMSEWVESRSRCQRYGDSGLRVVPGGPLPMVLLGLAIPFLIRGSLVRWRSQRAGSAASESGSAASSHPPATSDRTGDV